MPRSEEEFVLRWIETDINKTPAERLEIVSVPTGHQTFGFNQIEGSEGKCPCKPRRISSVVLLKSKIPVVQNSDDPTSFLTIHEVVDTDVTMPIPLLPHLTMN